MRSEKRKKFKKNKNKKWKEKRRSLRRRREIVQLEVYIFTGCLSGVVRTVPFRRLIAGYYEFPPV
jgi:hypothetical protein